MLAEALGDTVRSAKDVHVESHRHAIEAMELNQQKLFSMIEHDFVSQVLARDGVLPYILSPEDKVKAEIQALCKASGMTPEEAVGWMAISGKKVWDAEDRNGKHGQPPVRDR